MTIMTTQKLPEVLPKHGVLYQEVAAGMALCKPKLMPLKSMTLEKLEKMQKEAQDTLKEQDAQEREAERESFQQGMADIARFSGGAQPSTSSWQLNRTNNARFESAPSAETSSAPPDVLTTAGDGS